MTGKSSEYKLINRRLEIHLLEYTIETRTSSDEIDKQVRTELSLSQNIDQKSIVVDREVDLQGEKARMKTEERLLILFE